MSSTWKNRRHHGQKQQPVAGNSSCSCRLRIQKHFKLTSQPQTTPIDIEPTSILKTTPCKFRIYRKNPSYYIASCVLGARATAYYRHPRKLMEFIYGSAICTVQNSATKNHPWRYQIAAHPQARDIVDRCRLRIQEDPVSA